MNTVLAQGINHTPFELVFEQKPRVNLSLRETITQQRTEDQDDILELIKDQLDEQHKNVDNQGSKIEIN